MLDQVCFSNVNKTSALVSVRSMGERNVKK